MIATFIGLLFITGLLGLLLHLRKVRESSLADELPSDKLTVLIGIYQMLSKACLQYYKDYGSYPERITGASDSLLEAGYLKGELLASLSKSLPRFSIVINETIGSAICLPNTRRELATELITRLREMASTMVFVDLRGNQYLPLTVPIAHDTVNLCLLLPHDPTKSPLEKAAEVKVVVA
ncbi:MAG: hypothetical protein HQM06_14060 [Magnetococcales bacterium]|nr:hypothetical protein [Magnetococcales bacterium]